MKAIFLCLIRIYQTYVPDTLKRRCIFRESCSCHVYRQTKNAGIIAGIKALVLRSKICRQGYRVFTINERFKMQLVNGDVIDEKFISRRIVDPYHSAIAALNGKLNDVSVSGIELSPKVQGNWKPSPS